MKSSSVLPLAIVLSLAVGASVAADNPKQAATPQHAPLRPTGQCLVPAQVLDWGVIDERRLVVKTLGQRYFDIQLTHRCPNLQRRPYLSFRDGLQPMRLGSGRGFVRGTAADPVTTDGRICGDLGDAVVPRSGGLRNGLDLPCDIARVRRIDKNAFEGVFGKNGAEANRLLDASPSVASSR